MTNIIYEPTPKQIEFHKDTSDWLIVAGNRGGGKSMAALIECLGLQYGAHIKGGWQCLVIRRTYKQLLELTTRAKRLYPQIIKGITWNGSDHRFTYPNGSFIQFMSIERDEDVEKLRGLEASLIFVDELSHFSSDYVWQFLKGSNRNSSGYPNRMIGTSNPSLWVKKMCQINDNGDDNILIKEYKDSETGEIIKKKLRFMKMSMDDNKHLPKDYKQSMMDLPKNLYDEWVLNLWHTPKVPGQVLEIELERLDKEERANSRLSEELGLPVHVFCDLGYSDYTVLLFVQFVGKEVRILDFYANNRCPVDHYIAEINKRYSNVLVHLPHDGAKHESDGRSVRDYWADRIKLSEDSPNGNLPRLSDVESFDRLRNGFSSIWFDSVKCKELIDHLRQYRRQWNENLQVYGEPIHDQHSHFYDALKYIFYIDKKINAPLDIKKVQPQMMNLCPW